MRHLFFVIVLLASVPVIGQETKGRSISSETKDHKHPGTRFGFKTGFNRSDVKGIEKDGDKTGYTGGELYAAFFADSKLNTKINLGYELLFSWTNDYHFVEIPLHVKYNFDNRWSGFAGPKLDILLDDQEDSKTFGASAELGVQYNFFKWLFAEGRYAQGFTRHVTDPILDINKAKRNTLRIGLGIRF